MSAAPFPKRAMVLAAGLGLRMRPLTDALPKPLIEVGGRTLLDRALDRCAAAGIETVVVNTHYLAERIERHVAARAASGQSAPRIVLAYEPELLETGGGVANALPRLVPGPFFVVNSDALWLDGKEDTLKRMAAAWDASSMDGLLLLQPARAMPGYEGAGDFARASDGRLARRAPGGQAPYVYVGVQLLSERLFDGVAVERFSINILYDRAIARGRLFGLVHEGAAFHVGAPESIALAERGLGP
ncbi:MAG TPA: nucleotidyltransferase family protein [Alphaproteobacteria bacterium]|nr:nucleotidyltransferase family protein [Alphaproteobacteria bacterium]